MTPKLKILTNVIQRLNSISIPNTGHLYGIMYNNALTVLTFNINVQNEHDDSVIINHTMLQLNMPVEVDLCGILHIGQCEEKLPDAFKDIDVTDNPLLLKYSLNDSKLQSYFYVHQKLEIINNVEVITEEELYQQFLYIQVQGSIPLLTLKENIIDALQDSRKNIASGKVGIYFPNNNTYLFNSSNSLGDFNVKESFNLSQEYEGPVNGKSKQKSSAGAVDVISAVIFLKISRDKVSEDFIKYAPVLQHVKSTFTSIECKLNIDTISLVSCNIAASELYDILIESVCRNIKLVEQFFNEQLQEENSEIRLPQFLHFKPEGCGHLITLLYPYGCSNEDKFEYRKSLHRVLALSMTRPLFRKENCLQFTNNDETKELVVNPHESISQASAIDGKLSLVYGLYSYHHYGQDNFNDNGWGCAYRSLQTIVSWYRLQGYLSQSIPTHLEIQKCLVDIGDKSPNFEGSKQWIGSTEVGFVLESLFGINVKILYASSGDEVSSFAPDLAYHFQHHGTPVMIGGGVLAHTILGVDYSESSGDVRFLILDPHYVGSENLNVILSKGWCGWKTKDFWKKNAFYNMCLPQRPICI
ncbi:ufm1-specific protease 2 isoform X2 [Prorops nasuta]|uniref:ufm1-specific protease 2 isoform X2 n=1 Tax=Prorops nasuta TaxID=863751 RepID=UPI0034CFADCF